MRKTREPTLEEILEEQGIEPIDCVDVKKADKGFKLLKKTWYKATIERNIPDHTLFLIRTNGNIDIYPECLPDTIFRIKRKGDKTPRGIWLGSSKLLALPYGDDLVKIWIAHESETYPYPKDIKQDNTMFMRILEKIMMNYREMESNEWKQWLQYALIGACIIVGIGYLLYTYGPALKGVLPGAKAAAETVAPSVTVIS